MVPDTVIGPNCALTLDGVEIVTQQMGPGEATGATVFSLPATGGLYAGDRVPSGTRGFFLGERSTEILAALDRLRALFPEAVTLHPGHGDPGRFNALVDARQHYAEAARGIAAAALARGLRGEDAVAHVERALLDAYRDHGVPGGQPNTVELSVEGLLAERARERAAPPEGAR